MSASRISEKPEAPVGNQSLSEAEWRLHDVASSTPGAIYQFRRAPEGSGWLTYMSEGLRLIGDLGEAFPLTDFDAFMDLVHEDDRAPLSAAVARSAATLQPLQHEFRLVTPAGPRWLDSRSLPRREADGTTVFNGLMIDVTERVAAEHRLAESEARFRQIYQRTPIMLHSLDGDGRILAVSDYWLKHLGYARDEVIDRSIGNFIPDGAAESRARVRACLREHGACAEVPGQMIRDGGEVIDVLVSAEAEFDDNGTLIGSLSVLVDVSEHRRVEARYQDIFENTAVGIYRADTGGKLVRANPALVRLHGFDTEAELLDAVSQDATGWYTDPDARARLLRIIARDGRAVDFEAEIVRQATGERIWSSENARPVHDAAGRLSGYEGTIRDITARYRARRVSIHRGEILEMIARGASLTQTLYEIVGGTEQHWGRLTAAIFRLYEGRLYTIAAPGLSNACIRAVDGAAPGHIGNAIGEALRADIPNADAADVRIAEPTMADSPFTRALQASGYGEVVATSIRDQHGAPLGVLAGFARQAPTEPNALREFLTEMAQIASVAMEQHRLSQELLRQAHYDPLTDLPNRALLTDRLGQAIRDAERGPDAVAVLLLDLDDFKLVNDTLGHSAGDKLLCDVAARLEACMQAGDTVGRLGGDEFVLILPLQDQAGATDIANRVFTRLQDSIEIAGRRIAARPSIGIGIYPQDGKTPESLFQAADTAMYAAKHAGKNRFRFFTEAMNIAMNERLRIETELRTALEGDELVLHYQPRVSLVDGHIVGAEALLRWQHPERGLLPPGEFLPVAERGPLIGEIDRRVLRDAVRRAAAWQRRGRRLVLSVNLSTYELHAEGFGTELARIVIEAGIDPAGLELEITESMLMHDFERAKRQLAALKERAPGARIAIDDFGSGYSSLNYLRHLPLDTLKIDRSFVADLDHPESAATAGAIAKTIADLGRNLGLTVVAEGIEKAAQAEILRGFGCREAQGFWFDAALPIATFERRLDG